MINSFDVSVLNMKMACTQLTLPVLFNLQWTKNTLLLWISRWSDKVAWSCISGCFRGGCASPAVRNTRCRVVTLSTPIRYLLEAVEPVGLDEELLRDYHSFSRPYCSILSVMTHNIKQ